MDDDLARCVEEFEHCTYVRDHEAAEKLLHADFALVLVHPAPAVIDRQRWMGMLGDYLVHSWEVEERIIHEHGDGAAVLQRIDMQATVLGENRNGLFVITDLWQRQGHRWQLWRRHSTPLAAGIVPGT